MANISVPSRSDIRPVEIQVLKETEQWINCVESNFWTLLSREQLIKFYEKHSKRFRKEKKTPVSLEDYIANAESWIIRYIELFREEGEEIRTGILPPWLEQKKLIHEKRGLLLVYDEVINAAGSIWDNQEGEEINPESVMEKVNEFSSAVQDITLRDL